MAKNDKIHTTKHPIHDVTTIVVQHLHHRSFYINTLHQVTGELENWCFFWFFCGKIISFSKILDLVFKFQNYIVIIQIFNFNIFTMPTKGSVVYRGSGGFYSNFMEHFVNF